MDNSRHRFIVSLLAVLTTLSAAEAIPTAGARPAPKLVVNILVDRLRSDYLNAFLPLYGEDGFKRLLNQGLVYSQAESTALPTDMATAAADIATGTSASDHGIIGLRRLDRTTLRPVGCVDDKSFTGINTSTASSPQYLAVSTIGDELKAATEGKALVYAIAPFREAAILTAGHAADGAVWIDDATGQWCSTQYYGAMPAWVNVRNSTASPAMQIKGLTWKPSSPLVGNFSYFLSGGMKRPFSHKFVGDERFRLYKTSGLVNEEVARLAEQCLSATSIGTDALTDYLALTLYAGNFNHRPASAAPMELQDTYVRLDQALAKILAAVEQKVGLDNTLFVLTSTGTEDEENEDLNKYKIPGGTFDVKRSVSLLNMYLSAVYGQGQYIESCLGTQLYLDRKLLERRQLNLSNVLEHIQDFLLQLEGVKDVYTSQRLLQGAWTPGINKVRNGYNPRFSGDVYIEVAPGWRYVNADTHENQLVRASYVPFPIIFFGYGVAAGQIGTPVTVDYIAPTLSQAMRIRAPNACKLAPLKIN